MKNTLIFVLALAVLSACATGEDANAELEINLDNQLTGKWQLIEHLMDPGDGSGVFQPIASDHTIEMLKDGTFKSNKSLCYAGGDADKGTEGTIDSERSVLILEGCQRDEDLPKFELAYNLKESNLIINLFCIEPCALKFKKLK
ncbi:hypothetical protein QQ020_33770 [Fulvivirgaceae bacterium BMA12]|uniref:Lipocalin-like domain-containing protein n=1 Tax=Agaribacillus aureus TaxID=3051825 RepID=A0ABT8LH05_9BACT|nr:hypothetical protein [Fulvivirgaceae bacterium BMA12]